MTFKKRIYMDYLDSTEWWTLRRLAMRRAQWRCQNEQPGDPRHEGPLEVHHLHYRTLGYERLEDLEVLCAACHRAKRIPRNLRKLVLESHGQERLFPRWKTDAADNEAA